MKRDITFNKTGWELSVRIFFTRFLFRVTVRGLEPRLAISTVLPSWGGGLSVSLRCLAKIWGADSVQETAAVVVPYFHWTIFHLEFGWWRGRYLTDHNLPWLFSWFETWVPESLHMIYILFKLTRPLSEPKVVRFSLSALELLPNMRICLRWTIKMKFQGVNISPPFAIFIQPENGKVLL